MKRILLAVAVVLAGGLIANAQDTTSLLSTFLVGLRNGTIGNTTLNLTYSAADGTSGAPSHTFASEPTLGFYRSAAGIVTVVGALVLSGTNSLSVGGDVTLGAANMVRFGARGKVRSGADGIFTVLNNGETIGSEFKVDALPVASACGAGSPAVVAGSTPMSGAVTIGTTSVATCTITFGGTAYPSAPHCSGAVETTTAANARTMGYSASATVLTIVPSAAWVDSSVVNWVCVSSK